MARHPVDRRSPSEGGRLKHFLRIAREGSESLWRGLRRRPEDKAGPNRRAVEYARIERGRQA